MSLQRGKRRRRERRRREDGFGPTSEPEILAKPEPARRGRRQAKPLSSRSPVLPAVFAVLCVVGAFFTLAGYRASHWNVAFAGFYLLLAIVEAYLAFRIYRARGGSWR